MALANFESPIRWGIVGCGDVTEVKSGPALQKAKGSQLVAVMRRNGELAADYARRHKVPFWCDDADVLINRPDVDIVYIATPPGSHLELALKVCAAGKPCYVEKPMARSAFESGFMREAFLRARLPLYVAFYRRGQPRFRTVKQMLEEGRIGTLTSLSYVYTGARHRDGESEAFPWRVDATTAGAGYFYDLASHTLDIFDFLFGPLERVTGLAANRASRYAVEDTVTMTFLAGGAPSVAQWNFAATDWRDLIEIRGSEGKISLSCFGRDPIVLETANGRTEFDGTPPEHVHQPLVQTIVDELLGRGECPSTGSTALRTMHVMDTVLDSYYGGRSDPFWERPHTWPRA